MTSNEVTIYDGGLFSGQYSQYSNGSKYCHPSVHFWRHMNDATEACALCWKLTQQSKLIASVSATIDVAKTPAKKKYNIKIKSADSGQSNTPTHWKEEQKFSTAFSERFHGVAELN